jgi:glycosyltransferase involved in cell wall biosynthesis
MRILQIHKDFEPFAGGGGTARHIHGLAKALAAKGCEVRIVSINPTIVTEPYLSMDGSGGELARQLDWADVVHVHGARSSYAFRGALKAYRRKIPFLYTPHAYYGGKTALNRAFKWLWDRTAEKFLLEKGWQTILLTDAWYGFFSDRGISVKKTSIIPNCVLEEDLATPLDAKDAPHIPGNPAILTVGRLDPVKRVKDVIQALANPLLPQAHFHIVGRGAERAPLEALAQELGVADRVSFHGFVDDPGVAAMVAGSDVFVLASEQEGLPTVLLEMLFARLPIVCTRIPGNLAITDIAGITTTYDVGDIPALAALLAAAGGDTVSDSAVANLRASFLWETRANDVLALYTAAVAARTKK